MAARLDTLHASPPRLAAIVRAAPSVTGRAEIVAGLVVLAGWVLDLDLLTRVVAGWPAMVPNTAIGLILAGASLWSLGDERVLARRRLGQVCAAGVAFIGLATLTEYVTGWDLGIDQLLFPGQAGTSLTPTPGRPSPPTALNLSLVGLALWGLDLRTPHGDRPAQILALVVGLISLRALVGYAYGITSLSAFTSDTGVAVHTALAFLLLAVGLLCARHDCGLPAIVTRASPGGVLVRRLLPVLAAVLVGLGWLIVAAEPGWPTDTAFAVSLLVIASLGIFTGLIWLQAEGLDEADAERQRTEDALRASEERFRVAADTAQDAMVSADSRGDITYVNPSAERMFGHRARDLIGRPLTLLMPDRFHAAHRQGLQRYLRTGEARVIGGRVELAGRRIDGTEFPLELSLATWTVGGERYFTGIIRDITERQRLEEIRRRAEAEERHRIREANRLKSEFLANMSHELRTPLNAIIGFTELVYDGRLGRGEQREALGDILASSRHLLQLINGVLDLAKVESGKLEFRPEPVDVGTVVREVTEILRAMASQKRIRVETSIDRSLTGVVADPAKLKQVLYNYLSNALKFTSDAGRVTVRARLDGLRHFRLEVEDTGIGIHAQDLARLFVEFQQLDASAGKHYEGTGLGLALTKRLVEAQGGHVGVQSAPGAGSVFFAVLPRVLTETSVAAPPVEAASVLGAPLVLVIEDEPADQAWIVHALRDAGYAVAVAATGAEAVARCQEQAFDAVTLDLILPDMSAADVMKAIRSEGRRRDVAVVAVTVVAEERATRSLDVAEVLIKPVEAADLLDALRRAGAPPPDRSVAPGGPGGLPAGA